METIILDQIPVDFNMELMLRRLHLKKDQSYFKEFEKLVEEAVGIARPKAITCLSFIEEKGEDYVMLDGARLSSRILRVNLDQTHRTFPFVVTCGEELAEWAHTKTELLDRYWAEEICEETMRVASKAIQAEIDRQYEPGRLSSMSPGSLDDWPLAEQLPLFSILGNVEEAIGVKLNKGMMMIPAKSVSGLYFPSEKPFASCQLCPRKNCPSRKAAFVEGLYEEKYMASSQGR